MLLWSRKPVTSKIFSKCQLVALEHISSFLYVFFEDFQNKFFKSSINYHVKRIYAKSKVKVVCTSYHYIEYARIQVFNDLYSPEWRQICRFCLYTGECGLVKTRNLAFFMQFISSGLTSLS